MDTSPEKYEQGYKSKESGKGCESPPFAEIHFFDSYENLNVSFPLRIVKAGNNFLTLVPIGKKKCSFQVKISIDNIIDVGNVGDEKPCNCLHCRNIFHEQRDLVARAFAQPLMCHKGQGRALNSHLARKYTPTLVSDTPTGHANYNQEDDSWDSPTLQDFMQWVTIQYMKLSQIVRIEQEKYGILQNRFTKLKRAFLHITPME